MAVEMNNLSSTEEIENFLEEYQLWAMWETHCWVCGQKIKVAMDTETWSFNPFGSSLRSMWLEDTDDKIESALKTLGVKRELRFSKTMETSYIANVCPHCGALQGDWFIHEEFTDKMLYDPDESFRLLLFKDGVLVDKIPSVEEFTKKYWKMFLFSDLALLEKCPICGSYMADDPKVFKKYLEEHPESKEILERFGKIRRKVRHHINYKENKVIFICNSCHAKIHHSQDPKYYRFHPMDKRGVRHE